MLIESVPLEIVDFRDERFRLSEELVSENLQRSLKEVGLICPVVLLPVGEKRRVIVCGFRRLHALRRMGATHAAGRLLDPAQHGPLEAFRIALWDNLAHRKLGLLESARAVRVLEHECGLPRNAIVRDYLPLLGFSPRDEILRSCLALHALRPRLRRLLGEGRITETTAGRLASHSGEEQDRAADLLERVKLSASRQREVLELVDAVGGSRKFSGALDVAGVAAALADTGMTPVERGEKIRRFLFERQYPRLTGAEERFRSSKASLGLTGRIRVRHEPFFESSRIFVEFEADSAEEFRAAAESLGGAARGDSLEGLFKVW